MAHKTMEAGVPFVKALDAASATGVGDEYALRQPTSKFTVQGEATTVTAATISLEGSINGVDWFDLGTYAWVAAEIAAKKAMFHVINRVANFVRPNLTVFTGGGTMDILITPGRE